MQELFLDTSGKETRLSYSSIKKAYNITNARLRYASVHERINFNPCKAFDILNKPGALLAEEFEIIKMHPVYSYEMLKQSGEIDQDVLRAVRQHHEKTNGTGYPDGASLDKISLYARITSVSDVYDAMVSKRCYKDANSPFDILEQLKENRFSDLDLNIVKIFLENITYLFVGMRVKLSNGEGGEIVFVSPNDYKNPVVKVGDRIITTNQDLKCISTESNF